MEGPSFFAGPLLDFFPAFFGDFGSNGIFNQYYQLILELKLHMLIYF